MDDTPYLNDGADASLRKTVSLLNKINDKTGGSGNALTDTQLRATPVPVELSGVTQSGRVVVDLAKTSLSDPVPVAFNSNNALPVSGKITADPNRGPMQNGYGQIAMANSPQTIFAPLPTRTYCIVQNLSDTDMFLGVGHVPSSTNGLRLAKNGGGAVFDSSFIPTEAINIICSSGGKRFMAYQAPPVGGGGGGGGGSGSGSGSGGGSGSEGSGGSGSGSGGGGEGIGDFLLDDGNILKMWLKEGGPPNPWLDLSGNNNHAVQNNLSLQPTVGSDNGLIHRVFNGTQYFTIPNPLTGTSAELFAVVKPDNVSPNGPVIGNIGSANEPSVYLVANSGEVAMPTSLFRNQRTPPATIFNYPQDYSSWHLCNIVSGTPDAGGVPGDSSGYYQVRVNNLIKFNYYPQWSRETYEQDGPFIGRSTQGGSDTYFQGKIAEIMLYNRALTVAERAVVQTYLNNKYSLWT